MPRTKPTIEQDFKGKLSIKDFQAALEKIEETYQIPRERTIEILTQSIAKAVSDTLYPHLKITLKAKDGTLKEADSSKDVKISVQFDNDGNIRVYECKDVVEEVEDDLYQIEPDEAKEEDPKHRDYQIGDTFTSEISIAEMPYGFFTRAIQNVISAIKDTTKQLLTAKYSDRVGQIIMATVDSFENGNYYLSINNVNAVLDKSNVIPGEKFSVGQTIKVLLKKIGSTDSNGEKVPSLIVSRTDNLFLQRIFEEEIPDLAEGTIKIENIARIPGERAKVAVSSNLPGVDAAGSCIGSNGERIRSICQEVKDKIDIISYNTNPYLYIYEALKPAEVVGVQITDKVSEKGNKIAIAVVKNDGSRVAIGRNGVNVRLASFLTGFSIDIEELDTAIKEKIPYESVDKLRLKLAIAGLTNEDNLTDSEDQTELENISDEEINQAAGGDLSIQEEPKEKVEETVKEEKAEEVKPAKEEVVEHVEIKNTAKISLSELEAKIEEEKKARSSETVSQHKKKEKKEEKEEQPKINYQNAMPIYTQEELEEFEQEEQEEDNYEEEEDYSEYDDDNYYDQDK